MHTVLRSANPLGLGCGMAGGREALVLEVGESLGVLGGP